ncbi:MAG: hypothetical protein O3A01_00560 [bacterium]|nr:hypothetical protein [bacterium]
MATPPITRNPVSTPSTHHRSGKDDCRAFAGTVGCAAGVATVVSGALAAYAGQSACGAELPIVCGILSLVGNRNDGRLLVRHPAPKEIKWL